MLPRQPLRFVLADDPGAGKTIMAGLYIRELIMRADSRRILVVAPGSLVEQWRDELSEKFGLHFNVFSSALEAATPTGNPFEDLDHLIVRLDQMTRNEENQQKLLATTWDLVIFDETMGLAEDVRYYGAWMREEAQKRIGHLYPPVEVTAEMAKERPDLKPLVGQKLTVIAWLWARTVKSPNPAFSHVDVPLASTFVLYSKDGKEAYVQPVLEGERYRFAVKVGMPPPSTDDGTKAKGRGANFRCIISDSPIDGDYIKAEAQAGRMGAKLLAVVAEGSRSRVYLSPTADIEAVACGAAPIWKPDVEFFQQALGFRVGNYGMTKWSDLFTPISPTGF